MDGLRCLSKFCNIFKGSISLKMIEKRGNKVSLLSGITPEHNDALLPSGHKVKNLSLMRS